MIYAPWPTKKTTVAHYWAMAHRLKTPALHDLKVHLDPHRSMKATYFVTMTTLILSFQIWRTPEECKENLKHIHNTFVSEKITKLHTPHPMAFIHQNKHYYIVGIAKLAQHKANKSPLLQRDLHTLSPDTYTLQ